jgi:hypothetical protein
MYSFSTENDNPMPASSSDKQNATLATPQLHLWLSRPSGATIRNGFSIHTSYVQYAFCRMDVTVMTSSLASGHNLMSIYVLGATGHFLFLHIVNDSRNSVHC